MSSKAWPMPQLWRNDEEMAKKDDDHKLGTKRASAPWNAARPPRPAWVLRIVAYLLATAALVLLLFHATSLDRASDDSYGRYIPGLPPKALSAPYPYAKTDTSRARDYNGPITQPELAESLRPVIAVSPGSANNRNVLFAAASLQSAATLLPMACQMASARQNQVHFVLVGRDDIPLKELLKINGIDSTCPLTMHDARPNKAAASTDRRMTLAVERAMAVFHRVAHPQAILIDATDAEDMYLRRAVRDQAKKTQSALIELPERPQSRLAWITKLDASALAAWNKVRFDIVVHSPRTGTGNLKRLLRSIARADLGGHSVPHLVVELPSTVEAPLERFLAGYNWPPPYPGEKLMPSMLSLRRRIPRQKLTEEESSARFLESFWPSDPLHSHVLVLSPHMEVSPHFFHYVKYSLLFQRHSRAAFGESRHSTMMAMSLSVPTTILGSTRPFTPPPPLRAGEAESAAGTAFLWQAPTSDAVLVMGDKWVELHGYVSQVLDRQHAMSASPAMLASKEVGKQYSAWMEYALQLSRLRGYLTLYPSRQTADAIAGAHTDLPERPEEYQGQAGTREKDKDMVDMLETLPGEGEQQLLGSLPVLSWDGQQIRDDALEEGAVQLTMDFRQQVGQCSFEDSAKLARADRYARDLFCQTGEDRG
ncbi:glycosyltransferase 2 [Hirsutella rhossiliensis]|uniref:Glycosyltransferase 2 n=1 Tax=Hirsutella rhossiliensis TaxID=111463 RepID=A0A9P8SL03_9HYPO|nr:glycosyltransferase 2 [Hirsutella rhossiliensis]KAH0965764.1 glycosyltransferase 2 [Hirsutella rhossiliensis]